MSKPNPSAATSLAAAASSSTNRASGSNLPLPYSQAPVVPTARKETRGPNRTSKTANKLKVLPTSSTKSPSTAQQQAQNPSKPITEDDDGDDDDDDDEDAVAGGDGVHFYDALSHIPAGSARRDAMRLTKTEKAKLPRVTAYCTAAGFNLPALQAYFESRSSSYRCNPRLFEAECLHTPYLPAAPSMSHPDGSPLLRARRDDKTTRDTVPEADLLNLGEPAVQTKPSNEVPVGEGDHHAEGIDESEQLLQTKQTHQEDDRRRLSHSINPDNAFSTSERLKREAQDLNDREVHERRRQHLAKRVTGFATKPSALNAGPPRRRSRKGSRASEHEAASDREDEDGDEEWVPDVFVFEYGTVVIWGMTEREEKRVLANLRKFEIEKLSVEDIEMEDLNFYYANYSRIYNDVITLRKGSSFMTKLSLSHALSQSVKISLFEELISATIDQTKDLPKSLSESGKIGMPRKEIMKQIGSLFILRINWGGSILETPEFFWSYPDLEPLYQAARSYLEITTRIDLLNARVEVLQDMLTLLKESVNSTHGERLETIVIWLIGVEIILGIMTILVDVVSGA